MGTNIGSDDNGGRQLTVYGDGGNITGVQTTLGITLGGGGDIMPPEPLFGDLWPALGPATSPARAQSKWAQSQRSPKGDDLEAGFLHLKQCNNQKVGVLTSEH